LRLPGSKPIKKVKKPFDLQHVVIQLSRQNMLIQLGRPVRI